MTESNTEFTELEAQARRMLEAQNEQYEPARFWAKCRSVIALCEEYRRVSIALDIARRMLERER